MFKKKYGRVAGGGKPHYWFTIQSGSNTLATSEIYTTAAMRDKGIEAVKKVVWNIVSVKEAARWAGEEAWDKANKTGKGSTYHTVGSQRLRHSPCRSLRPVEIQMPHPAAPRDTFNIENKKGKIVKR